jgi:hypothetical protein
MEGSRDEVNKFVELLSRGDHLLKCRRVRK